MIILDEPTNYLDREALGWVDGDDDGSGDDGSGGDDDGDYDYDDGDSNDGEMFILLNI